MTNRRSPPGRAPTLDDAGPKWLWVHCINTAAYCNHKAPMALVPLVIRWGPGTPVDRLRRSARCTRCGHKGAMVTVPGWNKEDGYQAFPARDRW